MVNPSCYYNYRYHMYIYIIKWRQNVHHVEFYQQPYRSKLGRNWWLLYVAHWFPKQPKSMLKSVTPVADNQITRSIGYILQNYMMTSWHGNVFSITGPLWGESTGHTTKCKPCAYSVFSDQWIPLLKTNNVGSVFMLWSYQDTKVR